MDLVSTDVTCLSGQARESVEKKMPGEEIITSSAPDRSISLPLALYRLPPVHLPGDGLRPVMVFPAGSLAANHNNGTTRYAGISGNNATCLGYNINAMGVQKNTRYL